LPCAALGRCGPWTAAVLRPSGSGGPTSGRARCARLWAVATYGGGLAGKRAARPWATVPCGSRLRRSAAGLAPPRLAPWRWRVSALWCCGSIRLWAPALCGWAGRLAPAPARLAPWRWRASAPAPGGDGLTGERVGGRWLV
jgi:hypothetical protein